MGQTFLFALFACVNLVSQQAAQPRSQIKIFSGPDDSYFQRTIHYVLEDNAYFYTIRNESIVKMDKRSMKIVGRGNLVDTAFLIGLPEATSKALEGHRLSFVDDQMDIREALKLLMRRFGASYSIAPDVIGTVTLTINDRPASEVLSLMLRQVDSTFREEGGVIQIFKRLPLSQRYSATNARFLQDRDWIYVFAGEEVIKFSKKRMRTEAIFPNN